MGYMQLGQDGLIGFGPAIHDGETAAYISLYFQAGDTLQEDKLVEMPLRHPSNGLNKNKGYFAHNDERITYEAFERLGPDVADETLSGYYARFVA